MDGPVSFPLRLDTLTWAYPMLQMTQRNDLFSLSVISSRPCRYCGGPYFSSRILFRRESMNRRPRAKTAKAAKQTRIPVKLSLYRGAYFLGYG